jgi:hypothetical protein
MFLSSAESPLMAGCQHPSSSSHATPNFYPLFQLCIFRLGSDENGNVGGGVFPER